MYLKQSYVKCKAQTVIIIYFTSTFLTKGLDSTIGLSKQIGKMEDCDAVLVKVLRYCGAVPFVKTNLPQLMLRYESCLCCGSKPEYLLWKKRHCFCPVSIF